MRYHEYEQVKIITAEGFRELEEKFNTAMIKLSRQRPRREIIDSKTWAIFYTEFFEEAETEMEQRELDGTELECKNCEYYRMILNYDGTEKMTTKKARCELWGCTIYKTGKAKPMCYERLKEVEK